MDAHAQTPTMSPAPERRQDTRHTTIRRCRLRGRRSLLFASGITQNCSRGGLLIGLPSARPLAVGDRVEVVVAWDGDALLRAGNAATGRIVRIEERSDEQRIAIAFDEPAMQLQVNHVRVAA
ncbi:MAG: PilZ domain-containing protein [Phycisphaerales bacterium]|nr:PilZ domain-containing protein [Phycisphaerales bacterium]